jgi:MerR family transcriptional regulator, copper efflux regulator
MPIVNSNLYVRVRVSQRPYRRLSIVSVADCSVGRPADSEAESGLLQVGQLAKMAGKTVRAIHLYEDLGLLRPAERSKGRFRLYEKDAVERLRWISKLQAVGFSLPELREIVSGQSGAGSAADAARHLAEVYEAKLREVQAKLAELHRLERELVTSLAYLDACQSACSEHVTVSSCPTCDRHRDRPDPPPLVAGAFLQPSPS